MELVVVGEVMEEDQAVAACHFETQVLVWTMTGSFLAVCGIYKCRKTNKYAFIEQCSESCIFEVLLNVLLQRTIPNGTSL